MTMGPTGQSIQTQVDLKYFKDTLRDLLPRHVGTDKERTFSRFPRAYRSVMYNDTSDLRENRHTKENREWCVCVRGGGGARGEVMVQQEEGRGDTVTCKGLYVHLSVIKLANRQELCPD